jgi:hypothetical protein
MEALDAPYMDISFLSMIRKRAGWLCALFLSEMLTATAMQRFQGEIEKAAVLAMFIPPRVPGRRPRPIEPPLPAPLRSRQRQTAWQSPGLCPPLPM